MAKVFLLPHYNFFEDEVLMQTKIKGVGPPFSHRARRTMEFIFIAVVFRSSACTAKKEEEEVMKALLTIVNILSAKKIGLIVKCKEK